MARSVENILQGTYIKTNVHVMFLLTKDFGECIRREACVHRALKWEKQH